MRPVLPCVGWLVMGGRMAGVHGGGGLADDRAGAVNLARERRSRESGPSPATKLERIADQCERLVWLDVPVRVPRSTVLCVAFDPLMLPVLPDWLALIVESTT